MTYRVAVTGAGGYLGGRLAASLASAPGVVVKAGVRHRVPWLKDIEQVVISETYSVDQFADFLDGSDALVHLGAPNEVRTADRPADILAETLNVSQRIAFVCRKVEIEQVAYPSTIHVYGSNIVEGATVSEETVPAPRDVYAMTRLVTEHIFQTCLARDTTFVTLRLRNVVGSPADLSVDRWSLIANDLCRQAFNFGKLSLTSDGTQWRDFLPITDACRALASAAGAQGDGFAILPTGTYNVASGEVITIRDLAVLVRSRWRIRTGIDLDIDAPEAPAVVPGAWRIANAKLLSRGFHMKSDIASSVDEIISLFLGTQQI